jgi:threonine/homoserine/homoserine lactone efflux protein
MEDVELIVKGALAGLAISAPVGPVNVLCISRAVERGRFAGLISGLGAGAADTIYGAIAGFSISFIIGFLERELFWIRLFGGLLLIGIGILYYRREPKPMKEAEGEPAHSEFVTAFLLNLTNPTTVLSFLAVLAALGMSGHKSWGHTLALVAGIFGGAMVWWTALVLVSAHFRDRFDQRARTWMNRIAGLAIGAFGGVTLLLAAAQKGK